MFGSTILDVAIGIVLSFLGVSLATSALTEAISSMLKWRQGTLLAGIKALVNDPAFNGLARDLYNHALINPLGSGVAQTVGALTHRPAYIDSKQFALALTNTLMIAPATATTAIGNIPNAQLRSAMQTLWTAAGDDIAAFQQSVATWFDASMDRVSGWYKRKTQLVGFCLALGIAALLNVNVLYEGAQIWRSPGVIEDVRNGAATEASTYKACVGQAQDTKGSADCAAVTAVDLTRQLEIANLIGWQPGPTPTGTAWSWLQAIASWIAVAVATLFGASFWFDTLQRLIQLRGAGNVPKKSDDTQPA